VSTSYLVGMVRKRQDATAHAKAKAEADRALKVSTLRNILALALPETIWKEIGIRPDTLHAVDPWGNAATSEVSTVFIDGVPLNLQAFISGSMGTQRIDIFPNDDDEVDWGEVAVELRLGPATVGGNVEALADALAEALGKRASASEFAARKSEEAP
jgi:hypothetical protein